MNKELQEHIEVAKKIIEYFCSKKKKQALSTLISCAEELEDYKLAAKVEAELGDKVRAQLQAIKDAPDGLPEKQEAQTDLDNEKTEDFSYRVGFNFCLNLVTPIHQRQALRVRELEKDFWYHKGGEDDGYDGKTLPISYKEAYEEEIRYDKRMREVMQEACDRIKKDPNWKHGENAYPSPHERAIVAGCQEAVKELQAELTRLKQKEELDVGKVAEILFEIDNPNPALLTNRFCGHNLWVHSEDTQNKYKKLATAIVSRFSLVNKELIDKALNRLGSPTMQYNKEIENEERAKIIQDVYEILSKAEKEKP